MHYATGGAGGVDDATLERAVADRLRLLRAEMDAATRRRDRAALEALGFEVRLLAHKPDRALMRRVRVGNTVRHTAAGVRRTAAADLAEIAGVLALDNGPRAGATAAGDARAIAEFLRRAGRPAVRRDPLAQRPGEDVEDWADRLEDAGAY